MKASYRNHIAIPGAEEQNPAQLRPYRFQNTFIASFIQSLEIEAVPMVKSRFLLCVLVAAVVLPNPGCNDFNFKGGMPVGGIVESSSVDVDAAADAVDHEDRRAVPDKRDDDDPRKGDNNKRRSWFDTNSSDQAESTPSRTEKKDTSRPGNSMPSQTEKWGKDRTMPSDSMPSRTAKWGKDKAKGSDTLPSRTKDSSKDRGLPSDSTFRKPLPSESR